MIDGGKHSSKIKRENHYNKLNSEVHRNVLKQHIVVDYYVTKLIDYKRYCKINTLLAYSSEINKEQKSNKNISERTRTHCKPCNIVIYSYKRKLSKNATNIHTSACKSNT